MKQFLFLLVITILISCEEKNEGSVAKEIAKDKWIDLSYDFSDKTLYWPTANTFKFDTAFHGVTPAGFYYFGSI